MTRVQDIRIEDYDYPLPDEQIARYPLPHRASSRLLYYDGAIEEHRFVDLPSLLPEGALLVRNDSRVIHARLHFYRESGARVEVFCLSPLEPSGYDEALSATKSCLWHCLVGNGRRWRMGERLRLDVDLLGEEHVTLEAERLSTQEVCFSWQGTSCSFAELLEIAGELPIPPYLNRGTEVSDLQTYQTTYARHEGSVAAPTAGLHFTPEIFGEIERRGISIESLTLHVGAGTFRPVQAEEIGGHDMHSELVSISRSLIEQLRQGRRPVIAIGTTSTRSLESLYHLGAVLLTEPDTNPAALHVEQWAPYGELSSMGFAPSRSESLGAILEYMDRHALEHLIFSTSIIIAPSYTFHIVEGLVTNFHQPRSTLLLLIAALIGEDWRRVYNYAQRQGFRFLSYGDSSFLYPSRDRLS